MSGALRVGLGVQANTPSNLVLNIAQSGPGIIAVNWDKAISGVLPILGYTLEMKTTGSTFVTVYDGHSDPDTNSYIVEGLTPGSYYQFRVYSHNFNGKSLSSTILGAYA